MDKKSYIYHLTMSDLSKIIKFATELNEKSTDGLPPVDQWNPEYCGDIGMEIKRDGTWYYMGTPIGRKRIVKLFSRILRKEDDNTYVLVTPVEKVLINVEDAPFIATYVEILGEGKELNLKFNTNVDDTIIASKDYPIRVVINKKTNEPSPYILIRRNLEAKISRPVFYELIEIAEHFNDKFGVWSGGSFFPFSNSKDVIIDE